MSGGGIGEGSGRTYPSGWYRATTSYFISWIHQKSQTRIAAMGPKNTLYADMKFRKPLAVAKIFQGTMTQAISAQMSWPRRISMYEGNSAARSLAAERLFAEILTPSAAREKAAAAKNWQARLGQLAMRVAGFQSREP